MILGEILINRMQLDYVPKYKYLRYGLDDPVTDEWEENCESYQKSGEC